MSGVSLYKYDQAMLKLQYCEQKLHRCKGQLAILIEKNIRMKSIIASHAPELCDPAEVLRHAIRHLRNQKGRGQHEAKKLMTNLAKSIDWEQQAPFRAAAPVAKVKPSEPSGTNSRTERK